MQLLYAPTSPYARKCRVVARERGLMDQIEEVAVNPYEDPALLHAKNPMGRVPALVLDDGTGVFDSPVICEYLDGLGSAAPLIPTSADRLKVLVAAALAQGIMDSAVAMTMEGRRPEGERSPAAVARCEAAIRRGLDVMKDHLQALPGGQSQNPVTLGHLACGIALGYLDLRHDHLKWRDGRGDLAAWFEDINARPSMQETDPN